MIRGKILLASLLAMGVIAAFLGLLQMWWAPLGDDTFFRVMITLVVCGSLASFLVAVDYDLPGSHAPMRSPMATSTVSRMSDTMIRKPKAAMRPREVRRVIR